MNSLLSGLSAQQLRRAAEVQDRLAALQKQLDRILGTPASGKAASPGKRRRMSAAARAKIAAAARARWARVRARRK